MPSRTFNERFLTISRRRPVERLNDVPHREPGLPAVHERLAEACIRAGDEDLVDGLRGLADPTSPIGVIVVLEPRAAAGRADGLASPPQKIVSVARSAPSTLPDTGASMIIVPRSRSLSAIWLFDAR